MLVSAWSAGAIPERVFESLLLGDDVLWAESWIQRAPEYWIDECRFHHQPLQPAHLQSEQQFINSIKRPF